MWKKVNIVFKLKSPIHIGYMPFKGFVVSPTRYYVLGRNLWGAITKRITEHLCDKPNAGDYKKIGREVMENFKFSYFYIYDGRMIYFPRYTYEGLKYGSDNKEITKSEFERRFVGSIISTAINFNGTAKDESLHEIEYINNKFKDENEDSNDVKIAGCIWINENVKILDKEVGINNKGIFIDDFNIIQELILGGESKYGFGHVLLDSINKIRPPELAPFKWEIYNKIEIKTNEFILSHLKYYKKIRFKGNFELLTGRGYYDPENMTKSSQKRKSPNKPGEVISTPEYYLSPGTVLLNEIQNVRISYDGRIIVCPE